MRGADPAIVLVPGMGMFGFGADKQTARVAGEFYLNAINAMRGAEAVSTYAPIPESEKVRIEYWELAEAKLRRRPKPEELAGRVGGGGGPGGPWSPGRGPASGGPPRGGWPPRAPAWCSPTGTRRRSRRQPPRSDPPTWRWTSPPTSPTRPASPRRSAWRPWR